MLICALRVVGSRLGLQRALIVLVGLLMVAPGAAAVWRVAGTFEPDTPYDTADWMFQDRPPSGASRLYFQVFTQVYAGDVGISPNVALLSTRNEAPVSEYPFGLFGVWKDCNGDGYIGAAEQAVREYSALLLSDSSACPATTGATTTWTAGAHNYNGWVSELVPISNEPFPGDKRFYRDDATMVWGDLGRPDAPSGASSCWTDDVIPQGSLASTGAILNFVGCRAEQKGISPAFHAVNVAADAIGDPAGMRFEDASDARSGSLGQVETLGDEDSTQSPVYVWDCSSGSATPSPSVNDPDSRSVAAFFNHTYEGIPIVEDCDPTSDYGEEAYGLAEDNERSVDPRNKTRPEWYFDYRSGSRGGVPLGPALGPGVSGAPGLDAGLGWTGNDLTTGGWYPTWNAWAKLGPDVARVDLEQGSAGLPGAYWMTFYGYVSAETTNRGFDRPGASGVYGSWACGDNDSGIHNGWNCDPAMWYTRTSGGPLPLPNYPVARVGQTYQFRDVDCYDGTNSVGVPLGTAGYGTDACT